MRASAPSHRRAVAVESFQTAAACIGPVEPGMSLFAITRGQFSMVDAVLHVLDQCGPSRLSNTAARPALLVTYLDALITYREAQANIDANGAIVFHPRTGAPIENPYLAVRDRAARVLVAAKLRSEL